MFLFQRKFYIFSCLIIILKIFSSISAKDMLIKFWDIDTRHCFKTIVCHKSEVNDMILLNNEERLITGCHDNELRVFEITFKESIYENASEIQPGLKKLKINCLDDEKQNFDSDDEGTNETVSVLNCELIGSLIRESKDQLSQLCVDKSYTIFSAHSANEKQVELFKINTKDEIKKRLSKKLKKQKRKLVNGDKNSDSDNNGEFIFYI
jgi:U3 small nucleolar RNA-associated protein 12